MDDFPAGAEFAVEAWQLHELTNCATDASAKDEFTLQIADGVRSDNGNAPPIYSQTCEALFCTTGLTTEDAPTRICTIASRSRRRPCNTNDRTRSAMALVAIGSSPPPRTGDRVEFCATCFGVGHGAGVCPTKPGYAAQCCSYCRNGGHDASH